MKKVIRKLIAKLYILLVEKPKQRGMIKLLDNIEELNETLILSHIAHAKHYEATGEYLFPVEIFPHVEYEIYMDYYKFIEKKLVIDQ